MLYGSKGNSMLTNYLAACTHLSKNSFPVIRTASAKNCRFHVPQPTFLFLLQTPLRLSRNMLHGWKDNSMLAKPLAACTHLSSIVSESFYHTPYYLSYHAFDAPIRGFPSEYRHPLWDGKTRMVSLPDGEKISKICLFVLTWSTNVTDGRTDRHCMTA